MGRFLKKNWIKSTKNLKMNRELKFRAWTGEEMVYLPLAGLQYFDFEGSYVLSFAVVGYAGFWEHECYEGRSKETGEYPVMQYLGLRDKNGIDIYEGDFLSLVRTDELFNSGFQNSNAGQFMTKHNVDELLIRLDLSEYLCPYYTIYFLRDGIPLRDVDIHSNGDLPSDVKEHTKEEWFEPFTEKGRDFPFLKYLSNKVVVKDNVYENPELLKK